MANTINENPFVKQLFDTKAQNPNNKPGQEISDLAKAKQLADVDYSPSRQATVAAARMMQVEQAYHYSETMSLQLTTKEGDKVTVDFRQLYAQYQSYKETQATQEGPQGVRYFESREAMEMTAFEERFAFSVEGELNEDELNAIYDVFAKVDELADNFFGGNIEKALEQAQNLSLDMNQLTGIKLNLQQTETRVVSYQQQALAQYQKAQQQAEADQPAQTDEADSTAAAEANMAELPEHYQTWQDVINRLDEHFENAQNFFNNLMADTNAERFPEQGSRETWLEKVESFYQRLAEWAKQSAPESTADESAQTGSEDLTASADVAVE